MKQIQISDFMYINFERLKDESHKDDEHMMVALMDAFEIVRQIKRLFGC